MELMYIYIDKYRIFENEKIVFSTKFLIDYDKSRKKLSIKENKDYFNIYPDNIVNINGIFGKNATGKTSLLSLIGEKIEYRYRAHEIYFEEESDPHEKIRLKNVRDLGEIKVNSSYFLLYYVNQDESDKPIFVFETNNPGEYIDIFDNSEKWEGWTEKRKYYLEKGWFSIVFRVEGEKKILLGTTQNFPEDKCIQKDAGIICFRRNYYKNNFDIVQVNDEEYRIAMKRKTVPMQSLFLKSQIKFLVKQMKNDSLKKQIYTDDKYILSLKFASIQPSVTSQELGIDFEINQVIDDYREFKINKFEKWEKIVLAFLNQIIWYILTVAKYSNNDLICKNKNLLTKLYRMRASANCLNFNEIKEMYYQNIKLILEEISDKDLTLSELEKCERALESFLKNAENFGFDYYYKKGNELIIEISEKSQPKYIESFFDDFIDKSMHDNMRRKDSIMNGFLTVDVKWMSDGEKENLALFTSIDEQICLNSDKNKYILLFDEIERSMHPDMCRCLIKNLINFLGQYLNKEFQLIIASHSPFIASDLLQENIVCLSREGNKSIVTKNMVKPFAQNIYSLLKSQFFLNSFIGEYARECINLIVECLECKETEDAKQKINKFLRVIENSEKYITSKEDVRKFIQYIIKSIGEPIISNELLRRLVDKNWYSVEEKIQYYRKKIDELEEISND